jgi:acetoin utilization deacetylase AcuC-like enzyme
VLPIVFHPAYSVPLPAGHRFPMPKFKALHDVLEALELVGRRNRFQPGSAPRSWLELVHTPDYVGHILAQTLPREAERRLGLPDRKSVV